MSARSGSPFTASQWQELEHQALIFKYMVSGVPIPPDLIFPIKRSMDASVSSRLFSHQPIGWGCFQMSFSRKADPEPGRCRRTDGKKWRCSKEACPDSKYCERHMHRGRNRSRKPVEVITANTSTTISSIPINPSAIINNSSANSSSYSLPSLSSSVAAETNHQHHSYYNIPHHPFLYPHSSSSRPPGNGFSLQNNSSTHLFLDSGSYSQADKDYRYFHGLKGEVDERAFFSETSRTARSAPDSSLDNSWRFTPLAQSKQRSCSALQGDYSQPQLQSLTDISKQQKQQQEQHCFVLGADFKSERPQKMEREEEPQQPLRHFFDEWPPKSRDSWLDLEDDRSNRASFSTTQLSISTPMPSLDFAISNFRTQNDG
ncbi:PREDICTED: growth-regulating factor 1-like [Nelumbo nucifera]|uniref:Growth-regulating factor n=1 Tax=Nelumbo nucifera TaxID=4432 RepID=A0A1U8A9Q8_NELNU|nr:PREDICTED: growth-regulating factor 1-like [Nelumbo nucifera]